MDTIKPLFTATACFGGALDYVATQQKRNAKGAAVTCSVSIGPREHRPYYARTRGPQEYGRRW
jgi:organic hydroperoxide reductase OsmC/OhrA